MYSVNGFWCLLDGIHVIFLCVIMVVIFWRIKISDIVLMGIMVFFVVFLLILLLILLDLYIFGVILILRILIFMSYSSCSSFSSSTPVISGALSNPSIVVSSSPTGLTF